MGKIYVVNIKQEDFSNKPGYFYVARSKALKSPLGNPYTHDGKRSSLAKLSFRTRKEAIEAYELYFDEMYGTDKDFTDAFNTIYECYKSGMDIYLGCFCHPQPCHADIIKKKLQQKLIMENKKAMP